MKTIRYPASPQKQRVRRRGHYGIIQILCSKKIFYTTVVIYIFSSTFYFHTRLWPIDVKNSEDVLILDSIAMDNIEATYQGARSHLEWAGRTITKVEPLDDLNVFQAVPLSATIDRRPIIIRKQMKDDEQGLHSDGKLLGCAISATTFVSKLDDIYLKHYKEYTPTCDVCIQFSNRIDMDNFLPGLGYQPISSYQDSLATKCFPGKASVSGRFTKWQQNDERFEGFGYPWTVDCQLSNGIKELTCREISSLQKQIRKRDDVQNIYFRTKFSLDAWFDIHYKGFHVTTTWPWNALMTHNDDRSIIASGIGKFWNDFSSDYVPNTFKDLRLAHVEGPTYHKVEYLESLSLESMIENEKSQGGIHQRFLINLFHLIRNAPHSTHLIAVVDGQANRTYQQLQKLLDTDISLLYPRYASIFRNTMNLQKFMLLELTGIGVKGSSSNSQSDFTLREILQIRGIKIKLVPYIMPNIAFEHSVCGGQYAFAPYLAARYAADYDVMMFVDGDTAIVENSKTLQEILFNRFYSKESSKCAGHRLRLIEQYVKPEYDSVDRILQCSIDLKSDRNKWDYVMKNCHLKEGHIVARTDAIYAFSVHHPDTIEKYLPDGLKDCITPGNLENDIYFLKEDEFVQLHLRDRERKEECSCFR